MKIEFYKHNLNQKDIDEVVQVLNSTFLTTASRTAEFESKLAKYTNNAYALGLMSATHGLELILRAFDIGPGDEVITTPMSFIATANSIEYVHATPVFVEAEATTGNIDASLVEAAITPKTKAIMVVHMYGQMCDMKTLRTIADKHNLKLIEDSAHCIEGIRAGQRPGNLSDAAIYSFYATKNITCGEGGAITINDSELNEWLKMGRLHGMSKNAADRYTNRYKHYDMEILGMKCNMSDIQAALLIHQIDRMDSFLARKEEIAQRYNSGFADNPNIQVPAVILEEPGDIHARHLYTIWVDPTRRDETLHKLQDSGIGVAVNFRPIHLMKYYREKYGFKPGDFPITEKIGGSNIAIPLYPKLTDEEVDYIIEQINLATLPA